MEEKKLEIGKIITFEPSDSFEFGVVYSVEEGGTKGMAAFINQCSWLGAVMLRDVSVDDGMIKVRHHYEAKMYDGHIETGVAFDWEANTNENDLAVLMKIAAKNPKEIEPFFDKYTEHDWQCRKEVAKFRKGIYDILASSNGEWVRLLWESCPETFLDIS